MTKKYEITGLDCAVCAQKLEDSLNKLDGVRAKIGFVAESLTFAADDNVFDLRLAEAKKLIKKYEPGVKLKET